MLIVNHDAWHRKHDDSSTPLVPSPKAHVYPNSREDLIDIVNLALKNYDAAVPAPLPEIRAAGSHWALSEAAVSGDFFVETQNPDSDPLGYSPLNRTLTNVIPACLTLQASAYYGALESKAQPLDDTLFHLVHVEAGTRIYELYSRLDFDHPYALQTMGGAGGQTIVGAFATGTHGGDILFPPLADCVVAIHLIAPALFSSKFAALPQLAAAAEYWIEPDRNIPLIDEGKLQAQYPKLPQEQQAIQVVRGDDLFDAVLVAAGRMGIIYSVVLKVGYQYCLEQVRTKDTWSNVKSWINDFSNPGFPQPPLKTPALPAAPRFLQVVVNPNGQPDDESEHTCYITRNWKQPLGPNPPGRDERRGPVIQASPLEFKNAGLRVPYPPANSSSFFSLPCSRDNPIQQLLANLTAAAGAVLLIAVAGAALADLSWNPAAISAAALALATAASVVALLAEAQAAAPAGALGNTVGLICNWCAANDFFWLVREIEEFVLGTQQVTPWDVTAISYAILDSHDYTDIECDNNINSLEVFLDASGPPDQVADYVNVIFQRMNELENGASWAKNVRQAFAGYVSLRFMSQSRGLIAMQQFKSTCSVEIAGFNAVNGTEPLQKKLEQDAVAMGGTVHWGQRNDLDFAAVEKSYGTGVVDPLSKWRAALSTFSGNGRLQTFSTNFTRMRGLEIVQPTIDSFTVTPAKAPTGTQAIVKWTSGDAPGPTSANPGTSVVLSISPPGQTITLGAPDGIYAVPIPAGISDFSLQLAYTLAGRVYTAVSTVQVQGT